MKTRLSYIIREIIGYFVFAVIYCIIIVTICCVSCGNSNEIYFDTEQQAVVKCKGTISNLYITSKDNKDYLHFSVLQGKKGSNTFSIKELNKNYSIEITSTLIDLHNFKLRPETEYEIENHSNGDTPNGKLIIKTDKNSSVIYADKTSCE
jgi:hypothetical protein